MRSLPQPPRTANIARTSLVAEHGVQRRSAACVGAGKVAETFEQIGREFGHQTHGPHCRSQLFEAETVGDESCRSDQSDSVALLQPRGFGELAGGGRCPGQ